MIDVENEVVSRVYEAVKAQHPDADVTSTYVREPASFPHVCIYQSDAFNDARYEDTLEDHFETISYEVNVYSNKDNGKKAEVKAIIAVVDDTMRQMNFRRTAMTPVPNMYDSTIYRMVAQYTAVTDGNYFYRRS